MPSDSAAHRMRWLVVLTFAVLMAGVVAFSVRRDVPAFSFCIALAAALHVAFEWVNRDA